MTTDDGVMDPTTEEAAEEAEVSEMDMDVDEAADLEVSSDDEEELVADDESAE